MILLFLARVTTICLVSFWSLVVGLIIGVFHSLFHKEFDSIRSNPVLEILLSFTTCLLISFYSSMKTYWWLEFSGPIAIFMYGLIITKYTRWNFSEFVEKNITTVFLLIACQCKIIVFILVGCIFMQSLGKAQALAGLLLVFCMLIIRFYQN